MKLGEFRKITTDIYDDTDIVINNSTIYTLLLH